MKFFTRFFGHATTPERSAPQAKERLKLALTHDRHGLEQGTMERIRAEIVRVVSKHLTIEAEDVQIQIDHSMGSNKLIASVPLRSSRRSPASVALKAPKAPEAPKSPKTRKRKKARR